MTNYCKDYKIKDCFKVKIRISIIHKLSFTTYIKQTNKIDGFFIVLEFYLLEIVY